MAKGKKPSLKTLIKAARQYAGCVVDVAKALKVHRDTIYRWQEQEPEFKAVMDQGNEFLVDLALSGLRHHLEEKSEKTIHYTLDRLARHKGFGQLIKVQDKSKFDEQLDDMSEEELLQMINKTNEKIGIANE